MPPRPAAGKILRGPAGDYLIALTFAYLALAVPSPGQSEDIPRTPVIDGEWLRVSHSPELPEIDSEPGEVVDHCFFVAANGKWQLWTQIRGTAIGRLFYRWEGGTKFEQQDWTPKGICWRADRESGESWQTGDQEFVHAPHVLVENGRLSLHKPQVVRRRRRAASHRTRVLCVGSHSGRQPILPIQFDSRIKESGLLDSSGIRHRASPPSALNKHQGEQ